MFSEWRPDLHVVRHEPPPHSRWFAGMDWGYTKPGCVVLLANDGTQTMVRWEYPFTKQTPYDVGVTMGLRMAEWPLQLPEYIASDSAMWAVSDGGPSIAQEVQRGLTAALGPNAPALLATPKGAGSRIAGWLRVHQGLRWTAAEDGSVPQWLRPQLIVHQDCKYLIRTLPALPRDPRNPEDVDTNADDHGADALRYALMSREPVAEAPEKDIPQDQHPGYLITGERRSRHRDPDTVLEEQLKEWEHLGVSPGGRYGRRMAQ
jgi:hypothetical protein